ncbi:MAG: D-glycero-alpha-D-manno-heptose-1,7-bisphosphate 7-phosphatase [Longimicrobiales bacterium]
MAETDEERTRRRAAFFDRDGTLIVEREYLSDPAAVELIPGATAGLRALRDLGFTLIVVTNQSGIARGLYGESEFWAVQDAVESLLAEDGIRIDAVYFCPHHPAFTGPCDCRKPGIALFLEAAETFELDLAGSVWIGDRVSDALPALRLGGIGFLVRTGYGREQESKAPPGIGVVDDIPAVANVLARAMVN